MKVVSRFLLLGTLVAAFTTSALADIQDPPANDYGPTRKLSRGLANVIFGFTELPDSVARINNREGNAAGATYGFIKGFGRVFFRFGAGVYEVALAPFPTYKGSYRPFYNSDVPWIHGGYSEFPPELGFESRYNYSRTDVNF